MNVLTTPKHKNKSAIGCQTNGILVKINTFDFFVNLLFIYLLLLEFKCNKTKKVTVFNRLKNTKYK